MLHVFLTKSNNTCADQHTTERDRATQLAVTETGRQTKYKMGRLIFRVSFSALSLVNLLRQPAQRKQCLRKIPKNQLCQRLDFCASGALRDRNIADPSWHFYLIWSFVLFGN